MKNNMTFGEAINVFMIMMNNLRPLIATDLKVYSEKDAKAINLCDLEVKEKILKIINAEDYSYILIDDNGSNCISYEFKMTIGFIFKEYNHDYIVKEYLNNGQILCERL